MAAARYSTDVLQEFYEPIQREVEGRIRDEEFILYTSDFDNMLHAWRMNISERDRNHNDLLMFARGYKEKFVEKVKEEIKNFKNVKVDFGMQVKFLKEVEDGETQTMKHYFGGGKEKPTYIFNK